MGKSIDIGKLIEFLNETPEHTFTKAIVGFTKKVVKIAKEWQKA